MAKRFTDTGKWDRAWFRKLEPNMKCAWIFLCDRCDHAGVWEIDEDAMQFFVGDEITVDAVIEVLGDKVERVGEDKLLLTAFNEFQYGELNPENRVHKSVIERLSKLGPYKGLSRALKGPKDKDKDKDKEKVLRGSAEGECAEVYSRYPRKEGKSDGLKRLGKDRKAGSTIEQMLEAVNRFVAHHKSLGTEKQYLPHFSTWTSSWRDWLDPETGKSESFAQTGGIDWDAIKGELT